MSLIVPKRKRQASYFFLQTNQFMCGTCRAILPGTPVGEHIDHFSIFEIISLSSPLVLGDFLLVIFILNIG